MTVSFDPQTHSYRDARGIQVPSVTWILSRAGLCDFSFVEQEIRDRAMERGKNVHWMLQLEDEGALNYKTVPKAMRPYRKAYLDWKRASGFIPELIEEPFISCYGFAGTLDRVGKFPRTRMFPAGSLAVVDFKTTKAGVQDWVRYQLTAYSVKAHPVLSIARTIRRIALALHPDGTYQVKEFPSSTWDTDWAIFNEAKRRVDAGHVDHQ